MNVNAELVESSAVKTVLQRVTNLWSDGVDFVNR